MNEDAVDEFSKNGTFTSYITSLLARQHKNPIISNSSTCFNQTIKSEKTKGKLVAYKASNNSINGDNGKQEYSIIHDNYSSIYLKNGTNVTRTRSKKYSTAFSNPTKKFVHSSSKSSPANLMAEARNYYATPNISNDDDTSSITVSDEHLNMVTLTSFTTQNQNFLNSSIGQSTRRNTNKLKFEPYRRNISKVKRSTIGRGILYQFKI